MYVKTFSTGTPTVVCLYPSFRSVQTLDNRMYRFLVDQREFKQKKRRKLPLHSISTSNTKKLITSKPLHTQNDILSVPILYDFGIH